MRHRGRSTRSPFRKAAGALASLFAAALLAALAPGGGHARHTPRAGASGPPAAAPDLARLPLSFLPNAGQLDSSVKYQMRAPGGTVFFREREVAYRLPAPRGVVRRKGDPPLLTSIELRVRFEGASERPSVEGRGVLPGTASYFIGSDPTRWRASLPTYEGIVYRRLYKGVDLSYDGAGGRLKSTYTVAAGADPSRIRWSYEGATGVRVDGKSGDLRISLPTNTADLAAAKAGRAVNGAAKGSAPEMVERAPVAWQEFDGRRAFVQARYEVADDGTVGFALGHYDRSRPLVIDPEIEWSYYVGGAGNDYGYAVALDPAGNIYVAGVTSSANFPVSAPPGAQALFGGKNDVFVVKLNPTGNVILYSTFLGGEEDDCAFGLALDGAGNAHLAGYTRSPNFPVANALQRGYRGGPADAFATKLSADGRALIYSTYLGGADEDVARAVALAPDGQAFLTGYTRSPDFPTANPLQAANAGMEDAFLLKLGADGTTVSYGTYLGGGGSDYGEAVTVDGNGSAHVVGSTESADFPVRHAEQVAKGVADDAFAAKFKPDGRSLVYSTFLGGGDSDFARAAGLDSSGNLYVAGFTRSADFPVAAPFQAANAGADDAFVASLKPNGNLRYSTYLGGDGDDNAFGLAVDCAGYVTLTGRTRSSNFPVQNRPSQGMRGADSNDVFVTRLQPGGQRLQFSTYLGGNSHEMGEAVALDTAGNAYVTGYTFSDEGFPKPPTDPHRGLLDEEMFILKVAEPTPAVAQCLPAGPAALAADPVE